MDYNFRSVVSMITNKCVVCKKQIANDSGHHTIHGLTVCGDCADIYEIIYALVNGTTNACYCKVTKR
jgi:hypothetical protein